MCCDKAVSILGFLLLLMVTMGGRAWAEEPRFVLKGEPEVVMAGGHGPCIDDFVPDAPARAFRTDDGKVALISAYQVNRFLRGPDLQHLSYDCKVVFQGEGNTNPAAYDGHEWIAAPYTLDGRHVQALVHDEYWGHLRPDLCPAAKYILCWNNHVIQAGSDDAGQSFHREGLAAAAPYHYDGTVGTHTGYFNPSNIIAANGWFYATIFATKWGVQEAGNCLIRTEHLDDPGSWRAWDGKAFTVRFIDAYRENADPQSHVCAPLPELHAPIGSIAFHRPSGRYVATMAAKGGFFFSTSSNLLDWTPPKILWTIPLSGEQGCTYGWVVNYPSIIDPTSPDRNFDSIGNDAYVYFTRFWVKDCALTMRRDLMRMKIGVAG